MPALTGFDKKWVTLQIVLVLKNHCKFEDEDENDDEDEAVAAWPR